MIFIVLKMMKSNAVLNVAAYECLYTVEPPCSTTSHKRPPPISNKLTTTTTFWHDGFIIFHCFHPPLVSDFLAYSVVPLFPLRANVCKNREKLKFRGHSQKIIFAHILSINRHK